MSKTENLSVATSGLNVVTSSLKVATSVKAARTIKLHHGLSNVATSRSNVATLAKESRVEEIQCLNIST